MLDLNGERCFDEDIGNVDLESRRERRANVFKSRTTMERKEASRLLDCWQLVGILIDDLIGKIGSGWNMTIRDFVVGDVWESSVGRGLWANRVPDLRKFPIFLTFSFPLFTFFF